jgi:gliding motility-associated-like protein
MYEREVEMENFSQGADGYLWFLTPIDASEDFEPTFEYPDTGNYDILLISYTDNNCIDSSYQTLAVEPVENVYVPNAFTPNGDETNDVFMVSTFGIKEEGFILRVFDRWGGIVFESNDLFKGWDGSHNGDFCKSDVYVYSVVYFDLNNSLNSFKGTVALIR